MSEKMLTFGSLFSGIGGFDLGFERAGMKCAWQCEIDKQAGAVLARHWPEVMRYEDVRTIGKHNLEPVDLVCGGFPCQDLSVAGKRKGLAGKRSGLWFEFHRILSELHPRWVVIENVPGLLSSNEGRDFAVLLSGLAELGYLSAWRVLDAQFFGAAQRRRRVFVVASLGDGRAAEVLFERAGVRWNPPTRGKAGEGVAAPIKANSPSRRNGGSNPIAGELIAAPITTKPYADNESQESRLAAAPLVSRMGKGPFTDPVNDNIIAFTPRASASRSMNAGEVVPTLESANNGAPAVAWDLQQMTNATNQSQPKDEYSPTLNQAGQMMVGVRRLTPTECERLQGFPDGWTGDQSDSARYKQLGNAVNVKVAEWLGNQIIEAANG